MSKIIGILHGPHDGQDYKVKSFRVVSRHHCGAVVGIPRLRVTRCRRSRSAMPFCRLPSSWSLRIPIGSS